MEPRRGSKKPAYYYSCTDTHAYFQTAIWIHTLPWQEDPASCVKTPARTFRIYPTVSLIHHHCHTSQLGLIDPQLVHGPARLMLISTFYLSYFFFFIFFAPLFHRFPIQGLRHTADSQASCRIKNKKEPWTKYGPRELSLKGSGSLSIVRESSEQAVCDWLARPRR